MVITCSRCKTKLKVTGERITPQGSKFKCSQCGAVLFIKKPVELNKDDNKIINDIDKYLVSEKIKFKEQRLKQERIIRIVSACLLPLFIGVGMTSFLALSKLLSTYVFLSLTVFVLLYSLASGVFEYIRINRMGHEKSIIFSFIQSIVFILIYIILMNLLD